MDFELLRRTLRGAAPSSEDLKRLGISVAEVEELISSFELRERGASVDCPLPPGVMGEFFRGYDPSYLEIGMVRFSSLPERTSLGWVIGQVEADPLVLDPDSGGIWVADLAATDRILWRCAANSEGFLSALMPAAGYLGRCMVNDLAQSNLNSKTEVLKQCVMNAGGAPYESFYKMLIGVE